MRLKFELKVAKPQASHSDDLKEVKYYTSLCALYAVHICTSLHIPYMSSFGLLFYAFFPTSVLFFFSYAHARFHEHFVYNSNIITVLFIPDDLQDLLVNIQISNTLHSFTFVITFLGASCGFFSLSARIFNSLLFVSIAGSIPLCFWELDFYLK